MAKLRQSLLFAVVLVLVVSGCKEKPQPQPSESPLVQTSPLALPSQQSPLAIPPPLPEGPLFTINTAVSVGDTVVRGTGGPGVPLRVVNVTQYASELGQGKVGPDGEYEIELSQGLRAGERMGLMLGDLAGTNLQADDFGHGPGYRDVPLIGVVFTSTLVVP